MYKSIYWKKSDHSDGKGFKMGENEAAAIKWTDIKDLEGENLGFDHRKILEDYKYGNRLNKPFDRHRYKESIIL